jgi:fructose-1,6-bisphosphatase II
LPQASLVTNHGDADYGIEIAVGGDQAIQIFFERRGTFRECNAQARGKFFFSGADKVLLKGVTYGPFAPNVAGEYLPEREQVRRDFAHILSIGCNCVRVYHLPPVWLLDTAGEMGLKVFVDVPWPKYVTFIRDEAAEEAAASGMKAALDELPIDGRIVIGARTGELLLPEGSVGAGGDRVDLALDPIEGRGVVARGGVGAMAMLAVAPEGELRRLPDMYMRTIAVGPRAREVIDLDRPVADNVQQVAASFGRQPLDITALVLDRPRHHDLIEELRAAGTRIKLIGDGTVTASISAAIRGTNDHLAIGIGGTRQAVLTAAALRCLGGGMQAQLWPTTRSQIESAREVGIEDVAHVFTEEDLATGDVIFVATGVTNGDLLRGVRFMADSARTHSLIMCMRCNWVRFDDGIHFFARERREEVRLLG